MQKIGAESRTIPGQVGDADEVFGLLLRTRLPDIPKDRIMINHSDTWNNGSPSFPKPRSRCSHDRYSKSQDAVTFKSKRAWERRTLHATCYMLHWPRDTTSHNQFNNRMGAAEEILQPHYHPPNSLTHPSLPLHPSTSRNERSGTSCSTPLLSWYWSPRGMSTVCTYPLRNSFKKERRERAEERGKKGKGRKNKRNSL